jgi:HEAT repeat protein
MGAAVSQRPRIFKILENCPDPGAGHALAAGLPLADPETQCQIIDIIVSRGQDLSLEALPDCFDRLSPPAQQKVVGGTAHLFGALRATVRSPSLQTRLNSLAIIRQGRNPRLAYLAAAGVRDGSHHVRAEAAATLRELTDLHCRSHAETASILREACDGEESLSATAAHTLNYLRDERRHLVAAVRETLEHFESHHRPEIIESAMYLADELEETLFSENALRRGKLTPPMLDLYGQSPSPRLAAFTYIALGHTELRRKIVATLSRLRNPAFFAELIRHHWLSRDPRIQRNLSAIRSLAWLGDGFEAAFTLPPNLAALAPAWISALGLASDHKVKLLTSFLLIDNPEANRAAAWALARMATPVADRALQGAADHENPHVRRIVEMELRHRRRSPRASSRLARPYRPQEWCDLLDQSGLREDFDDFWHHFDRIPREIATAAGPYAVQYVAGFQTEMQVRLIAQQPADRVRALKMLRDLNVADRFCKEVFSAANDPSPEVRAGAIPALGALGDPTSRRILDRALSDASPKVQAAAIEALDGLVAPRRMELFLPKIDHDDAEVRAAAVLALLRMHVPKAAIALVAMLKDDRSDHRAGALWIVDRLRLTALETRVADLAQGETDPRIVRIAQHVHRRLRKPSGGASPGFRTTVAAPTQGAAT